jgi:hypothetical protein
VVEVKTAFHGELWDLKGHAFSHAAKLRTGYGALAAGGMNYSQVRSLGG